MADDATLDVSTEATAANDVANPPAEAADFVPEGDTGQAPLPGELPAVGRHAADNGDSDIPEDELLHDDMAYSAQNPIKRAVIGYNDDAHPKIKAMFDNDEVETDRDTDEK